ncbi:MAG: hypothetical protein IJK93_06800 [Muribaculaceae bacterium]|nr:hypothetical protein [Muribaculaceae bacterium]
MSRDAIQHTLSSRRYHDVAYWALMVAACAVFLAMNVLTTFKEDDMAYSLIEGQWAHVQSLLDLVRSHANHFVHANGRTANLVAALFCGLLGKTLFNICNTIVFGFMAHLLSLLATGRRSLLVLAMFLAMVGTCYPVPGETMLWLDGSCNYMWAITLSLAMVWYLQQSHVNKPGWGKCAILLLAGVVAGSFNEATSFGFFAGLCLYYVFNTKRFDRTAAALLAGYLLGILIIVASPGAWHRAADGGIVVNLGFADLLSSRWFIFQEKTWRFHIPVAAILVGLVALFWKGFKTVRQSPWTYIFLCLALVMLVLGIAQERAYAAFVTAGFIIIAIAADRVFARWQWLRMAAVIVCLVLAAFTAARGIKVLNHYRDFDKATVEEIKDSPKQAVLLKRQFSEYSRFIKPMNYNSTDFFAHEVIYRAYYGKDNVQFVEDSIYTRYHDGRLLDGAVLHQTESDRPDIIGATYSFPDQDYMAIEILTDTLPCAFQTARCYQSTRSWENDSAERERRHNYGINIDYEPLGFYPLEYQGKRLIIFSQPDSSATHITFPLDMKSNPTEATIKFK